MSGNETPSTSNQQDDDHTASPAKTGCLTQRRKKCLICCGATSILALIATILFLTLGLRSIVQNVIRSSEVEVTTLSLLNPTTSAARLKFDGKLRRGSMGSAFPVAIPKLQLHLYAEIPASSSSSSPSRRLQSSSEGHRLPSGPMKVAEFTLPHTTLQRRDPSFAFESQLKIVDSYKWSQITALLASSPSDKSAEALLSHSLTLPQWSLKSPDTFSISLKLLGMPTPVRNLRFSQELKKDALGPPLSAGISDMAIQEFSMQGGETVGSGAQFLLEAAFTSPGRLQLVPLGDVEMQLLHEDVVVGRLTTQRATLMSGDNVWSIKGVLPSSSSSASTDERRRAAMNAFIGATLREDTSGMFLKGVSCSEPLYEEAVRSLRLSPSLGRLPGMSASSLLRSLTFESFMIDFTHHQSGDDPSDPIIGVEGIIVVDVRNPLGPSSPLIIEKVLMQSEVRHMDGAEGLIGVMNGILTPLPSPSGQQQGLPPSSPTSSELRNVTGGGAAGPPGIVALPVQPSIQRLQMKGTLHLTNQGEGFSNFVQLFMKADEMSLYMTKGMADYQVITALGHLDLRRIPFETLPGTSKPLKGLGGAGGEGGMNVRLLSLDFKTMPSSSSPSDPVNTTWTDSSSEIPQNGIVVEAQTELANPSSTTIVLGDVAFELLVSSDGGATPSGSESDADRRRRMSTADGVDEAVLGVIGARDVIMRPGKNVITLKGRLKAESAADASVISSVLSRYVKGEPLATRVRIAPMPENLADSFVFASDSVDAKEAGEAQSAPKQVGLKRRPAWFYSALDGFQTTSRLPSLTEMAKNRLPKNTTATTADSPESKSPSATSSIVQGVQYGDLTLTVTAASASEVQLSTIVVVDVLNPIDPVPVIVKGVAVDLSVSSLIDKKQPSLEIATMKTDYASVRMLKTPSLTKTGADNNLAQTLRFSIALDGAMDMHGRTDNLITLAKALLGSSGDEKRPPLNPSLIINGDAAARVVSPMGPMELLDMPFASEMGIAASAFMEDLRPSLSHFAITSMELKRDPQSESYLAKDLKLHLDIETTIYNPADANIVLQGIALPLFMELPTVGLSGHFSLTTDRILAQPKPTTLRLQGSLAPTDSSTMRTVPEEFERLANSMFSGDAMAVRLKGGDHRADQKAGDDVDTNTRSNPPSWLRAVLNEVDTSMKLQGDLGSGFIDTVKMSELAIEPLSDYELKLRGILKVVIKPPFDISTISLVVESVGVEGELLWYDAEDIAERPIRVGRLSFSDRSPAESSVTDSQYPGRLVLTFELEDTLHLEPPSSSTNAAGADLIPFSRYVARLASVGDALLVMEGKSRVKALVDVSAYTTSSSSSSSPPKKGERLLLPFSLKDIPLAVDMSLGVPKGKDGGPAGIGVEMANLRFLPSSTLSNDKGNGVSIVDDAEGLLIEAEATINNPTEATLALGRLRFDLFLPGEELPDQQDLPNDDHAGALPERLRPVILGAPQKKPDFIPSSPPLKGDDDGAADGASSAQGRGSLIYLGSVSPASDEDVVLKGGQPTRMTLKGTLKTSPKSRKIVSSHFSKYMAGDDLPMYVKTRPQEPRHTDDGGPDENGEGKASARWIREMLDALEIKTLMPPLAEMQQQQQKDGAAQSSSSGMIDDVSLDNFTLRLGEATDDGTVPMSGIVKVSVRSPFGEDVPILIEKVGMSVTVSPSATKDGKVKRSLPIARLVSFDNPVDAASHKKSVGQNGAIIVTFPVEGVLHLEEHGKPFADLVESVMSQQQEDHADEKAQDGEQTGRKDEQIAWKYLRVEGTGQATVKTPLAILDISQLPLSSTIPLVPPQQTATSSSESMNVVISDLLLLTSPAHIVSMPSFAANLSHPPTRHPTGWVGIFSRVEMQSALSMTVDMTGLSLSCRLVFGGAVIGAFSTTSSLIIAPNTSNATEANQFTLEGYLWTTADESTSIEAMDLLLKASIGQTTTTEKMTVEGVSLTRVAPSTPKDSNVKSSTVLSSPWMDYLSRALHFVTPLPSMSGASDMMRSATAERIAIVPQKDDSSLLSMEISVLPEFSPPLGTSPPIAISGLDVTGTISADNYRPFGAVHFTGETIDFRGGAAALTTTSPSRDLLVLKGKVQLAEEGMVLSDFLASYIRLLTTTATSSTASSASTEIDMKGTLNALVTIGTLDTPLMLRNFTLNQSFPLPGPSSLPSDGSGSNRESQIEANNTTAMSFAVEQISFSGDDPAQGLTVECVAVLFNPTPVDFLIGDIRLELDMYIESSNNVERGIRAGYIESKNVRILPGEASLSFHGLMKPSASDVQHLSAMITSYMLGQDLKVRLSLSPPLPSSPSSGHPLPKWVRPIFEALPLDMKVPPLEKLSGAEGIAGISKSQLISSVDLKDFFIHLDQFEGSSSLTTTTAVSSQSGADDDDASFPIDGVISVVIVSPLGPKVQLGVEDVTLDINMYDSKDATGPLLGVMKSAKLDVKKSQMIVKEENTSNDAGDGSGEDHPKVAEIHIEVPLNARVTLTNAGKNAAHFAKRLLGQDDESSAKQLHVYLSGEANSTTITPMGRMHLKALPISQLIPVDVIDLARVTSTVKKVQKDDEDHDRQEEEGGLFRLEDFRIEEFLYLFDASQPSAAAAARTSGGDQRPLGSLDGELLAYISGEGDLSNSSSEKNDDNIDANDEVDDVTAAENPATTRSPVLRESSSSRYDDRSTSPEPPSPHTTSSPRPLDVSLIGRRGPPPPLRPSDATPTKQRFIAPNWEPATPPPLPSSRDRPSLFESLSASSPTRFLQRESRTANGMRISAQVSLNNPSPIGMLLGRLDWSVALPDDDTVVPTPPTSHYSQIGLFSAPNVTLLPAGEKSFIKFNGALQAPSSTTQEQSEDDAGMTTTDFWRDFVQRLFSSTPPLLRISAAPGPNSSAPRWYRDILDELQLTLPSSAVMTSTSLVHAISVSSLELSPLPKSSDDATSDNEVVGLRGKVLITLINPFGSLPIALTSLGMRAEILSGVDEADKVDAVLGLLDVPSQDAVSLTRDAASPTNHLFFGYDFKGSLNIPSASVDHIEQLVTNVLKPSSSSAETSSSSSASLPTLNIPEIRLKALAEAEVDTPLGDFPLKGIAMNLPLPISIDPSTIFDSIEMEDIAFTPSQAQTSSSSSLHFTTAVTVTLPSDFPMKMSLGEVVLEFGLAKTARGNDRTTPQSQDDDRREGESSNSSASTSAFPPILGDLTLSPLHLHRGQVRLPVRGRLFAQRTIGDGESSAHINSADASEALDTFISQYITGQTSSIRVRGIRATLSDSERTRPNWLNRAIAAVDVVMPIAGLKSPPFEKVQMSNIRLSTLVDDSLVSMVQQQPSSTASSPASLPPNKVRLSSTVSVEFRNPLGASYPISLSSLSVSMRLHQHNTQSKKMIQLGSLELQDIKAETSPGSREDTLVVRVEVEDALMTLAEGGEHFGRMAAEMMRQKTQQGENELFVEGAIITRVVSPLGPLSLRDVPFESTMAIPPVELVPHPTKPISDFSLEDIVDGVRLQATSYITFASASSSSSSPISSLSLGSLPMSLYYEDALVAHLQLPNFSIARGNNPLLIRGIMKKGLTDVDAAKLMMARVVSGQTTEMVVRGPNPARAQQLNIPRWVLLSLEGISMKVPFTLSSSSSTRESEERSGDDHPSTTPKQSTLMRDVRLNGILVDFPSDTAPPLLSGGFTVVYDVPMGININFDIARLQLECELSLPGSNDGSSSEGPSSRRSLGRLSLTTDDIRHVRAERKFSAAFRDGEMRLTPPQEENFIAFIYNMLHTKGSSVLVMTGEASLVLTTTLGEVAVTAIAVDVSNPIEHLEISSDQFSIGELGVQRGTREGLILETSSQLRNAAKFGARLGSLYFDLFVSTDGLPDRPSVYPPAREERGFIAAPSRTGDDAASRDRRRDRRGASSSSTIDQSSSEGLSSYPNNSSPSPTSEEGSVSDLLYVGQVRIVNMDMLPRTVSTIDIECVLFPTQPGDPDQGPRRLISQYVSRKPSTMLIRGRAETTSNRWLKRALQEFQTSLTIPGATKAMVEGATLSIDQLPFFGKSLEISSRLKLFNPFPVDVAVLYIDSRMMREGVALGRTVLDWRDDPMILEGETLTVTRPYKLDIELNPQSMVTFWESLQGTSFVSAQGIVEARIEEYGCVVDYDEERIRVGGGD